MQISEENIKKTVSQLRVEIKDVESLKLLFPNMFSGPISYFEFYKGWFPDYVDLCFEVNSIMGKYNDKFFWHNLKESRGVYKMFYSFRQPLSDLSEFKGSEIEKECLTVLKDRVIELVEIKTKKVSEKCCVCGDAAKTIIASGWMHTVCDYHNSKARTERGDDRIITELFFVPMKKGET